VTSCMYYSANGSIDTANTHILSTEGMVRHVRGSKATEFIVATETGILHKMRKENPDKIFYPASEEAVCKYMKMVTLDKVLISLQDNVYRVKVPEEVALKAKKAIERMLELA